jgi:cbb3-type cytochrome oxidase subunit 3
MHKEVLSRFDQPWLPITALALFGVCFIAYTYWTYKKSNKPIYDIASMMPLEDGVKHE